MSLKEHLKTIRPIDRPAFAQACGTTLGHLTNVAYGYRPCGESLAIAIERETNGTVRVEDLRPDVDWSVIRARPPRRVREAA